jgi:hypothetical protein
MSRGNLMISYISFSSYPNKIYSNVIPLQHSNKFYTKSAMSYKHYSPQTKVKSGYMTAAVGGPLELVHASRPKAPCCRGICNVPTEYLGSYKGLRRLNGITA